MTEPAQVVLVVDVANVMGSRPDGWWRDRAGAATRLLSHLPDLIGAEVTLPAGPATARITGIRAVLEGDAKRATGPDGVVVLRAERDGDREIVADADRLHAAGQLALVVTADRELRRRLPGQALSVGPRWLTDLLGR